MEKKQRSPFGDFIKETIIGGVIVSPVVDIAMNMFAKVPFKEAAKASFATAQGWKRNAKWGVILGVIGVGVNALTGRYKQEPEAAPAPVAAAEPAPTSVMEEAPQVSNHAQKEMARREEAAQQEAQIA